MTARFALVSVLLAGACADPPVTYSSPIGIRLQAKSTGAFNGVVADDKAITTEQGNPYAAFITGSKELLAGKTPTAIVIEGAMLRLGETSTNVTALPEVFSGSIDIGFLINDSNNSYGVASGEVEPATRQGLELDPRFDSAALTEFDYLKLLGGQFKVWARGTAAQGFADRSASADLEVTLTFSAFE
ncbi:MAG: hypothetical protein H0T46_24015 [Deltaproteobacteria bacterium]|nr:hypothetical protein [Deltaproteobacteria bacterium]